MNPTRTTRAQNQLHAVRGSAAELGETLIVDELGLTRVTGQDVMAFGQAFGLLAEPTRPRVLLLLCRGEQNVTEPCAALDLPQPTVSHHLVSCAGAACWSTAAT